ncbi:GNAT family N-acetyltransferase [Streptomyces sp. NPDC020845]|uniref:GNAT family N-acetyltransferase n=1 Tax=Streptomyces sp. NPDC020845 TaxID=3365096 RepID=UPI0037AE5C56
MPSNDLHRATAFRLSFARRQAAEVREVPGGFLVLDDDYARSHEHNQLHLDGSVSPAEVPDLAEASMAALPHRHLTIHDDALGAACAPYLTRVGYGHGTELVMTHTGPTPPAAPARAEPLDLPALAPALARQQRRWMPHADDETIRQLVERRTARLRGAERVQFLGVYAAGGDLASWADLYLASADGIAQVEDLVTADPHTRHGHADTLLADALHRSAAAGCTLRFLVADGDDWPRRWYARRGFTVVGRVHTFTRYTA